MTNKLAAPAPEWNELFKRWEIPDPNNAALRIAAPAPEIPYAVWRQGWDAVRKWKAENAAPDADALLKGIK